MLLVQPCLQQHDKTMDTWRGFTVRGWSTRVCKHRTMRHTRCIMPWLRCGAVSYAAVLICNKKLWLSISMPKYVPVFWRMSKGTASAPFYLFVGRLCLCVWVRLMMGKQSPSHISICPQMSRKDNFHHVDKETHRALNVSRPLTKVVLWRQVLALENTEFCP